MTKSTKAKLAYMTKYESSPEQVRRRVERNAARRDALKAGLVHKGDGKDVDHKVALDNGGTNALSNRRVVSEHKNRGWRRGKHGYNP